MNKEIILKDFRDTFSALINSIAAFDDESFNTVPFENSWTAGQVGQHLILANTGFAAVLNAKVKDTDRKIDELVARLQADFLNFDIKMQSPDFIHPEKKDYNKADQLAKMKEIEEVTIKEIAVLDLSKTCLAFELPGYGFLTRLEAIYFVIYHTQRHTQQLNRIHNAIKHP
ncbi:DinB family protein [Pedobacter sp. UC225_65]|uniref:DinB family protein n=1 Tax=Pedobacter sp. UC225_65 TaxID=3350173 RepID=UPI00366D5E29